MTATKKPTKPSRHPAWVKKWKLDNHRGIKRVVPADAAQAHVQDLQRHGATLCGIAEVAGVNKHLLSQLHRGLKAGVRRSTEAAILAVTPESVLARPKGAGLVPNIGGRRRIQALMAMGWRHQDLTPLLGIDSGNVLHQQGEWFTKNKHDAIKKLYDQLWNQRGPATAVSINRVIKAGYAPPLAWDDESIDDPAAVPNFGAKVSNIGMTAPGTIRKTDAIIEDVEFLLEEGLDWDAITGRLDINPKTLDRALHRRGRSDLIDRAKNMAERRAYARAS